MLVTRGLRAEALHRWRSIDQRTSAVIIPRLEQFTADVRHLAERLGQHQRIGR
jgi:hypothetical protein